MKTYTIKRVCVLAFSAFAFLSCGIDMPKQQPTSPSAGEQNRRG